MCIAETSAVPSDTPLLLLGGELTVLAASNSFCRAFGLDPALITGEPVFAMGSGEWDLPRLKSLLTATGSGGAKIEKYEMKGEEKKGGREEEGEKEGKKEERKEEEEKKKEKEKKEKRKEEGKGKEEKKEGKKEEEEREGREKKRKKGKEEEEKRHDVSVMNEVDRSTT